MELPWEVGQGVAQVSRGRGLTGVLEGAWPQGKARFRWGSPVPLMRGRGWGVARGRGPRGVPLRLGRGSVSGVASKGSGGVA